MALLLWNCLHWDIHLGRNSCFRYEISPETQIETLLVRWIRIIQKSQLSQQNNQLVKKLIVVFSSGICFSVIAIFSYAQFIQSGLSCRSTYIVYEFGNCAFMALLSDSFFFNFMGASCALAFMSNKKPVCFFPFLLSF